MDIKDYQIGMKKDWKINQQVYHRLNKNFKDNLNEVDIVYSDNVIENSINYFKNEEMRFIYPAKSYVVAICYAKWLSEDFNENFYDLLNDKELLYNNDPYYKIYNDDKYSYDMIIKSVFPINEKIGIISDIKKYYKEEFLL